MNLAYPYTVEPQEGGGLFVQFIDLEEAFTEGATPEEAAFNAAEVLSGILSHRLEQGDTIPAPSSAPDLAHTAPQRGGPGGHPLAPGARRAAPVRTGPRTGNLMGSSTTSGRSASLANAQATGSGGTGARQAAGAVAGVMPMFVSILLGSSLLDL